MAKRVKVKLNSSGMQGLLSGGEVADELVRVADSRAPSGSGYGVVRGSGGNRAHAFIGAMTWEAYADNSRNATLLNALGGGDMSNQMVRYTTKSGKTRWATQAQVDNWTRGSR